MKRNVILLAICQALMMTGSSLLVASVALIGVTLAPHPGLATLPLAFHFLAVMITTFPASMAMKKIGRKNGFMLGSIAAIIGASVCAYSIYLGNFAGYCIGVVLMGVFNAFGQYYRFAAADVATVDYRSRAISLVLAGGLLAAFAGPNLADFTRDLLVNATFAGGYGSLVLVYMLSLLVVSQLRIPTPGAEERSEGGRSLLTIARQPAYWTAVLSAMTAYGVMNLLMTSTPLAMQQHGHPFSSAALVIEWHIIGMYLPSFFTGHLINRFGVVKVMMAGAIVLILCTLVNIFGDDSVSAFLVALMLLGLGWNFLFIGGTTQLTTTYTLPEKAKAQGLNDMLVFATVACTALFSGVLHHTVGWSVLNYGVIPVVVLAAIAVLYASRTRRATTTNPGT